MATKGAELADEPGIVPTARLPYAALFGAVRCLGLAQGTRGEAEELQGALWHYMQAAEASASGEAIVPCDVLRAATLCLRKWRAVTDTTLWGDRDDAELTIAWREGLKARRPT
ncbi:hypothetical protein [Streptomyces longisporoflavus]|uniref:Uncharacterized protein n=1 Tax=Streptomyces longisporoflavus TaxID=28044 RepID=A0ABW7R5H0_9ACTN